MNPSPFYHLVPKDPWANVAFRKWCYRKACESKEFAHELWIMCARDLLFYCNTFGWLLEPRDKPQWKLIEQPFGNAKEIPFITRPYQDDALLRMQADLGKKDMVVFKSREMGATWMALYLFDWSWRFEPNSNFGLVSKDEDSVDNPDDPDSLMAKLDFIDVHLPAFLQPGQNSQRYRKRNSTNHTLRNLTNNSTISGYSCTGNMGRGGRKRAFWMDECHSWPAGDDHAAMASTQHITSCRIMCSTPNGDRGQAGAFYDVVTKDTSTDSTTRIILDWKMDHDKAAGLYMSDGESNDLRLIDKTYPFEAKYPFVLDGKIRSPYYDYECNRAGATPRAIAAELDMDFGGATSRFFDPALIARAFSGCRNPDCRAHLKKDCDVWIAQLIEDERGDIELWFPPGAEIDVDEHSGLIRLPQGRRYAMGCDISMGIGGPNSSYSAAVILDATSGEQIAEWRHNKMVPEQFAEYAATLGTAFNLAVICPEVTGVGLRFLSRIVEIGYRALWLRPQSKDSLMPGLSRRPGYENKDGGFQLLGELQDALRFDKVHVFSRRIIQECERYFVSEIGQLKHPLVGKGRVDAPEKSHGDSAIAAAAAWWGIHDEKEMPQAIREEQEAPLGSLAWRRKECGRQEGRKNPSYWDPLDSPQHVLQGSY